MTAIPSTIPADGVTPSQVKLMLAASAHKPAQGWRVDFELDDPNAKLVPHSLVTDANGAIDATLTAAQPGRISINARVLAQDKVLQLPLTAQVTASEVVYHAALTLNQNTIVAGEPVSLTLRILDDQNQLVDDYAGSFTASSTDAQATLPDAIVMTASEHGITTESNIIFRTAGRQSLQLTPTGATAVRASGAGVSTTISIAIEIDVQSAQAIQLAFMTQPSDVQVGRPVFPAVTLALQDAFGKGVAEALPVTLGLLNNPNQASLMGLSPVQDANGAWVFAQLGVDAASDGLTLTASVGSFQQTSQAFAALASIGGQITGLAAGDTLMLQNNNDLVTATANGAFAFAGLLHRGQNYNVVNISANISCVLTHAAGQVGATNVNDISVACSPAPTTHMLGGRVVGLSSGQVTLDNLANADAVTVGNGNFVFDQTVMQGSDYNVVLTSIPSDYNCLVAGGTGSMGHADNFNIVVTCNSLTGFSLGGTVSGLVSGNVTFVNNGDADTQVASNGNFTFAQKVPSGASYATAIVQPTGQQCTVTNGNGVMPAANVTNIAIACTPQSYALGGTVVGLASGTMVTLSNGNDTITPTNGNFTFPAALIYNSNFSVTLTQPTGQTCSLSGDTGVMPGSNDSNVRIVCTANTYSLGGRVSGLLSGTQVTLSDGNNTQGTSNGAYTFATPLPYLRPYSITVTNPTGQACVFSPAGAGSGTMPAAAVTNANLVCTTQTYSLGGHVSGLVSGSATLTNTANGDAINVGNGNFTFDQNVAYNSNYSVVSVAPTGQSCSITNANGTMAAGNTTQLAVVCSPNTYPLGGRISGLLTNTNVMLSDAYDSISRTNGAYVFPTQVAYQSAYSIGITQPVGQTCAFNPNSAGSGTMGAGAVSNANVVCVTNKYSLGGSVSGLASGSVQIANGADTLTLSANGNFTFAQSVFYNTGYNVTVTSNPPSTSCVVTQGAATMGNANVTNVAVACMAPAAISVMVAAIPTKPGNANVVLANGADTMTMTWTSFQGTFPTSVAPNGTYNVHVVSQTPNTTCTSRAPSGTVTGANVTVYFSCRTTTPVTLATNQNAARVIGQPNFTSSTAGSSASVTSGVTDYVVLSPNNVLFVSDKLNNRVLAFNPSPIVSSPSASFAVGQNDLVSNGSGTTANAFDSTQGAASDTNVFAIVDRINNRVLLWNTPPASNIAANVAVGQSSLTANSSSCSQTGLNMPYEAVFGGSALLVADYANNRIMIWNKAPTANMANANLVLGQTSFTNCAGHTTSSGVNNPYGVWSDGNRVLVADTGNNRVLVWNSFPTVNGQAADGILGQASATTSGHACTDHNLNTPYNVASDGVHIFVSDGFNYRVVVFNGFPTGYGTETIQAALGQTSLTSCNKNNGGNNNCSVNSFVYPSGLTVIGTSLYVGDLDNSRMLVFDSL